MLKIRYITFVISLFINRNDCSNFLAMPGNLDEARLLLIAIANGFDGKFDGNLTSFDGILFVQDAPMVLRGFRTKFTCLKRRNFRDFENHFFFGFYFHDFSCGIILRFLFSRNKEFSTNQFKNLRTN